MDAAKTLRPLAVAAVLLLAREVVAQPTPADFVTSVGNPQPLENALAGIGESSVDQLNGEFTYSVPIALPRYRGIEPHVALSYHSGGKNGPLGPGWGITGFSSILRVGVNHKTPDLLTANSTDIYLLDGMELIPCSLTGNNTSTRAGPVVQNATLSPSCNVGGTHATRLENYKRIRFDGTLWTVTERDGTVATYTPLNGQPTFWGRTAETSARGTVSYKWQCESGDTTAGTCIPVGITYGATAVTFHSTARSDHGLSFANGTPRLGESTGLYRSIEVVVDGAHAAAYNLTYSADPTSATSLLSGIQRFGKDYVLDASTQQITGGTAQPASKYSYTQLSPFASASVKTGGWAPSAADSFYLGDFNGDGRVDILIQSYVGSNLALFLATGDPSAPFTDPQMLFSGGSGGWVVNSGGAGKDVITTGDFDGDGRTDIMIVNSSSLPRQSKAAIFYGQSAPPYFSAPQVLWANADSPNFLGWPCAASGDSYVPGDFDGDGKTDLLFNGSRATGSDPNRPNVWIMWASGNRDAPFTSSQPLWGASGPNGATTGNYLGWILNSSGYRGPAGCSAPKSSIQTQFQIGDFDGDGKTDLALTGVWSNCTTASNSKQYYFKLLDATGNHSAPFAEGWAWTLSGHPFLTVGDSNGDGKTDLLTQTDTSNLSDVVVRFSTGNGVGFVPGPDLTTLNTAKPSCSSGAWSPWSFSEPLPCNDLISVGDFNGDGNADLLVYNRNQLGMRTGVILGGGSPTSGGATGVFSKVLTSMPALPAAAGVFIADFNGDGRSDIFDVGSWSAILSQGTRPMLLETIENGIGAQLRIAYSPSSRWPSSTEKVLPFVVQTVSQVSTTDGRVPDYPTGASQPVWSTRTYSYDTGGWDAVDRRFLGFGNTNLLEGPCVSTPPSGLSGSVCPYSSTSYLHDLGGYSRPYQVVTGVQDAVGNRRLYGINRLNYKLSTEASGPYQSLLTSEVHEEYDGSIAPMVASSVIGCANFPCASGRKTLATYSYDNGIGLRSNQCGALGIAGAQHVRIEAPSADGHSPQWTEVYYDGLGRTYRTLTKGPEARPIGVFSVYDALGRESYHSAPAYLGDALYWTRTGHDALGRVTSTVLPDGATATASYDLATCTAQGPGATCSRTTLREPLYSDSDPQSHISIALANARGQTVSATDPRGTTTYGYDVAGKLLSIIDAAGNRWKYTPDSLGRNVVIQDADLGTWNYRFDGLGNVLEEMDAIGQSSIVTYDALNRKRTKTTSASAATRAMWTYDEWRSGYSNIGHMTSATYSPGGDPDVSDQSNYDARGRLQLWQRSVGASAAAPFAADFTVSHSYDDGNRLIGSTSTVAVDGVTISTDSFGPVSFDGAARPFSVPGIVQSASYDAPGHLLTRANANSTALTNSFSPARGWLVTRSVSGPNGLLQSLDYRDRDAEGKVRSAANGMTGQTWLYSYDGADRLYNAKTSCGTDPKSAFYVYDAVDNILDRYMLSHGEYRKDHYVYGDTRHPHAVTSVGALSYSYDENGCMKQAPSYFVNGNGVIAPGANVAIEYDAFNHMVRRGSDVYAYDMNGDRVLENGRVFASDDLFVTRDAVSGSYSVTSYYSFGREKVAKRVSGTASGSGLFWLQSDLLGSVTSETDGSGTSSVYGAEQDYVPYGTPSWTNKPEALGFTGQQQSLSTGIVYLHARYYDPFIGRFMAADTASPLERGVGINRYAYMMNNPLGGSDPSGHGSAGGGSGDLFALFQFLSSPSTNPRQEQIKDEMRSAVELEVKATAVGVGVAAAAPFAAASAAEVGIPTVTASGIRTLAYSAVAPLVTVGQTLWQTGKDVLMSGLRTGLGVNLNRISETILEPLLQIAEDRFVDLGTAAQRELAIVKWDGEFATKQLLGSARTPRGKQINFHAADRMVNPPPGRVPMSPSAVDDFVDTADAIKKSKITNEGTSVTLLNSKYPKAQVVVDGNRVVTVINPKGQ